MSARLVLDHVSRTFKSRAGGKIWWRKDMTVAVCDVSLTVATGEIVALVGESGSGKSTTALLAMRLVEPVAGSVQYLEDGSNGPSLSRFEFSRRVQIIFQDPASALNARRTVREILTDALVLHTGRPAAGVMVDVIALLERVGLVPADLYLDRYPHQLSGGQKQRLCIARAISVRPRILIADEPVSALDVSVQGQILQLLLHLKNTEGIGILLISHDLAVVRAIADRVAVMYGGYIVESGQATEVFDAPKHPYTQLLLASIPLPQSATVTRHGKPLDRNPFTQAAQHHGCAFEPRCPLAHQKCVVQLPPLVVLGGTHAAACHAIKS